jgi:hypothetical protein
VVAAGGAEEKGSRGAAATRTARRSAGDRGVDAWPRSSDGGRGVEGPDAAAALEGQRWCWWASIRARARAATAGAGRGVVRPGARASPRASDGGRGDQRAMRARGSFRKRKTLRSLMDAAAWWSRGRRKEWVRVVRWIAPQVRAWLSEQRAVVVVVVVERRERESELSREALLCSSRSRGPDVSPQTHTHTHDNHIHRNHRHHSQRPTPHPADSARARKQARAQTENNESRFFENASSSRRATRHTTP